MNYTKIVLLIIAFGAINVGFRSAQFVMLADSVSGRVRSDFFASIASKDLSFFDRVNVGEIMGRQNSDTQVINEAMNNSFNTVTKALIYTFLVMAYLLYLSP